MGLTKSTSSIETKKPNSFHYKTARLRSVLPRLFALLLMPSILADLLPSNLSNAIFYILNRPIYARANWGLLVWDLTRDEPLLATNEHKLFVLASNTKLFTAMLALTVVGPEHRIQTPVYSLTKPDTNGILKGPLAIIGRADPSWCTRFQAGPSPSAWLKPVLNVLSLAGVKRVEGAIIADQSWFTDPPFAPGWEATDALYPFSAPVYPINFGENSFTIFIEAGEKPGTTAQIKTPWRLPPDEIPKCLVETTPPGRPVRLVWHQLPGRPRIIEGNIPVGAPRALAKLSCQDPAKWFLTALADHLGLNQTVVLHDFDVDQKTLPSMANAPGTLIVLRYRSIFDLSGNWNQLGQSASPPISEMLRYVLHESHNLTAQSLFMYVGALGKQGFAQARQGANAKLKELLSKLQIPTDEVQIEEGSGLSRRNLASPFAVVKLLRAAEQTKPNPLRELLPKGGREGTLRSRLPQLPSNALVQAKTGYLQNTYALSGYLKTVTGRNLAFSILLNNFVSTSETAGPTQDIDRIVTILAGL